MSALPVAIVGAGHVHAPGYLRCLLAHPEVEVVGLYDFDPQRASELATPAGVPVLGSPEEAFAHARAAVVCSEPTRQLGLVRKSVAAGLPTLCEKPLGTTLEEASELVGLAQQVPLSVAFPVRYHPAAIQLRQAVRSGALGGTPAVWATNRNSFPGGWFADPALAGGGCLLDHVVHVADLLRWIWEVEYATVTAEAGVLHRPGLQMEDTAVVLLECQGGMVVTIDPSMSRPQGMPGALDLVMEVWGQRGLAKIDIFSPRVESVDDHGVLRFDRVGYDMDASLVADWVGSVRHERPAPVPAADGFAASSLAFAAQRAAAGHGVVRLPLEDR